MTEELIKNYFYSANKISIEMMYLNKYCNNDIDINDLKEYNPGHLGTSMSINFILANLNYFMNKNNLNHKLVVGTGHAGVSLLSNLWLNHTLEEFYPKYSSNIQGLNNLIKDFGINFRSEVNPEYPNTIYDGGELGYSLAVAYGYALKSNKDIIPCIIGDGESETGTLCSSLQLNKILNTKSKVLPIINLNGLKMGSETFLSKLSDYELISYYKNFGYHPHIVDSTNMSLEKVIEEFQNILIICMHESSPLIIFKSLKGFTLPEINNMKFEGNVSVHKNPLSNYLLEDKLNIIKNLINNYSSNIFTDGKLNSSFDKFKTFDYEDEIKNVKLSNNNSNNLNNINQIAIYLKDIIEKNDGIVFSPDELYSNQFGILNNSTIELLNENVLQGLYQGYIQNGNLGFYISYEGFMPIISSMIIQYYKSLNQKSKLSFATKNNSLNYLLSSTCFENTYSHQNPDFINSLIMRDDKFYNILYPKDGDSAIKCIDKVIQEKDKINIITTSKRHIKKYGNNEYSDIEIVVPCDNPKLILCATGDYMLDLVCKISKETNNVKVIYVTNPKVLDKKSVKSLSDEKFENYFNNNIPIYYFFMGNPSIIKFLLYDRKVSCKVFGYIDNISEFGNLENNIKSNIKYDEIKKIYKKGGDTNG